MYTAKLCVRIRVVWWVRVRRRKRRRRSPGRFGGAHGIRLCTLRTSFDHGMSEYPEFNYSRMLHFFYSLYVKGHDNLSDIESVLVCDDRGEKAASVRACMNIHNMTTSMTSM